MCRKLWPKAAAEEDALGQMSKNFQVYFVCIIFFKNETKKITIQQELYCDAILFVFQFFIVYLPKKMETEEWLKAADSPLYKTNCRIHKETS